MNDPAFEQFVRDTHQKALRLAFDWLGDWEEARDAVQESFIRAHEKLDQYKGTSSFSTWYYRILANHLKDRLRRRKVRRFFTLFSLDEEKDAHEGLACGPGPGEELEAGSLRKELTRAVGQLPSRQGEVFRMKSLTAMTFAEIAETLGISDGAAKTHYGRAV